LANSGSLKRLPPAVLVAEQLWLSICWLEPLPKITL
jgi:hypothetical protein